MSHIHDWKGMVDPYVSFWFGSARAVCLLVYVCMAVGNTRLRLQSPSIYTRELKERAVINIVLVMERVQPKGINS